MCHGCWCPWCWPLLALLHHFWCCFLCCTIAFLCCWNWCHCFSANFCTVVGTVLCLLLLQSLLFVFFSCTVVFVLHWCHCFLAALVVVLVLAPLLFGAGSCVVVGATPWSLVLQKPLLALFFALLCHFLCSAGMVVFIVGTGTCILALGAAALKLHHCLLVLALPHYFLHCTMVAGAMTFDAVPWSFLHCCLLLLWWWLLLWCCCCGGHAITLVIASSFLLVSLPQCFL